MPAPGASRVLFVEQFYYPEGWGGAELPLDLTVHLQRTGFDVEVICGTDQYTPLAGEPPPDPRAAGVRIRRIPRLLSGNIHRAKLLRQLWFYVALAPLLVFRRPPAVFVTQTNPPLAVVLVAAAAWVWRRPLVIIAMDIYPEVLTAHGMVESHSMSARLLAQIFTWAYRRATRIVALGPVMRERLELKGVDAGRIVEIPNWATGTLGLVRGDQNGLLTQWQLQGRFVLLYSGNLGLAHEFDTLLEALAAVVPVHPRVRLVVIGRGSRLAAVRERVSRLGLDAAVLFSDLLPAERLPESFGIAQMAVVTLQPGFAGLVVPSKLQGYMARGLPTLYIGPDSDVDRFIRDSRGGVGFRNGDVTGVAAAIAQLAEDAGRLEQLGHDAREYYDRKFARAHGLARYATVIRSLLGTVRLP